MTSKTRTRARTVRVPTTTTSLLSTTERVARFSFGEESSREEEEEVAEDEIGKPFLSFGFGSLLGYDGR
jgi:DNA-directed RNA polymerase sigma subunit (sigma70/sigma32)